MIKIFKNLLKKITEFNKKTGIKKTFSFKVSPDINENEIDNIIELIKKFKLKV